MSTYETYYCNLTTDLTSVLPDLERYDQKKMITDWQVDSGSRYRSDSSGYIAMLFKNGKEMGAAQGSSGDVTSNDQWYFDSSADVVYFYNDANSPNEDRMEAGEDWVTLKTRKAQESAEQIRSYVPFPILPRKGVGTQSASSRDWDWIIVKANAILTVAGLISQSNAELAMELEKKVIDPEERLGLLDQLVAGHYHLWNQGEHQNMVRKVSINGSTTGDIVDVKGTPSVEFDCLKIVIDTGGTLAAGTASTLKYSTYGKDSTGIKISRIVNNETVTGGWDAAGHGMYVRFSAGVHTASDEYELEVSNMRENTEVKFARIFR